ncbi:MAG: hypothetical protein A3K10_03365 [Bacteroidetes bacterium RIFCSPLOWO2_12_FULL_31_6]|nr:MAG: hypothetical protein A3K10_03365 [Bacteroidetes bacterium RIFCSPLOWO2_12_FULL_31_6]
MKYLVFIFICVLFYSCDPYYKLQYCVKNQTTDTLYVKYKSFPDSLRVISPDSLCILKTIRGVGYAREIYKTEEFQTWFKENSLLIKKDKDNSLKKVSEAQWKYEGKKIYGDAILYVKK